MLGGGSINITVQVLTNEGKYFLKYNTKNHEGMFETEARGLNLLRETNVIYVPEVINWGRRDGQDYLVLENIEYTKPNSSYWETLGVKIANLHRNTDKKFGLNFDNYIGSLRQDNEQKNDWMSFFVEKRLNLQAGLAYYNELISKEVYQKFQKFYKILPELLPNEPASLLHGDLWIGNIITNSEGEPSLIDPAVYYGNREMEIAFTTLFGGFDQQFYDAYQEAYPLQPQFDIRVPIYNIYPLLVHANLFGTSYLAPVIRTLDKYL